MSSRFPLILRNLSAAYGATDVPVVQRFSAALQPGERLCVVGESGSGKSSLINAIAGFMPQIDGVAHVAGSPVNSSAASLQRARRHLGLVLQAHRTSLDPTQTALGAVIEPLTHLKGELPQPAREAAARMLLALGIGQELFDRRASQLSGGQCQRVAVARALVHSPPLLLADEPTAALDPSIARALLRTLLRRTQRHGTAMLYVTHRLEEPLLLEAKLGVLLSGWQVERLERLTDWSQAKHPYSRYLARSRNNSVPMFHTVAAGCPFQAGCPRARPVCKEEMPGEFELADGHFVRCFMYSDRVEPGSSST